MSTLEEILSQTVDEIKRPPPMPPGMYLAVVAGPPVPGKSQGENQTPYLEFKFNLVSPMSDVNSEELAAIGGIAGKQMSRRIFITDDSVWALDTFLFEHLGIELGKGRKEAIAEAPGRQVIVIVKKQPSKKGDRMVSFIEDTAKP